MFGTRIDEYLNFFVISVLKEKVCEYTVNCLIITNKNILFYYTHLHLVRIIIIKKRSFIGSTICLYLIW